MDAETQRRFVAVGSVLTESVTSKLVTTGVSYQHKLLESSPANWNIITRIVAGEDVGGVLLKLTRRDYERICRAEYTAAARLLFEAVSAKPYLLLVHEAVAGYPSPPPADRSTDADEDDEGVEWNDRIAREYFGEVDGSIREQVHGVLDDFGLSITTYKKNAEASILAAGFVDDVGSNLLFRFYIPSGRLFEDELARMLEMFHDWLGAVAGRTVRRDGYQTPSGRVIEFYGEPGNTASDWRGDLQQFSEFLTVVEDRDAAMKVLLAMGLSGARADDLFSRYRRDARRILLDTRHERERRMLQIRQELESELTDEASVPESVLTAAIDSLLPRAPSIDPYEGYGPLSGSRASRVLPSTQIVINQQFFERVEGVVAQNLAGTVQIGAPLDDVLRVLRELGGSDAERPQVAARELADASAPPAVRVRARQELKSFLVRNVHRMEQAAFDLAMKWVEGQIG